MMPPTKDQADIGKDEPTLDCNYDMYTGEPLADMARQEYKNDADINYMLSKFGIVPQRGAPLYGEWDDTIELQTALQSVHDARAGFRELPEELQKKFGSMEEFLTAYDNGSLVIKDEPAPEDKPADQP